MPNSMYDLAGKRVYVAGHRGMVGAAVVRRLGSEPCSVLTAPREVDLREQAAVREWFAANRPDAVVIAAACSRKSTSRGAVSTEHGSDPSRRTTAAPTMPRCPAT